MNGINEFQGLRIIESAMLTEAGEPYDVPRSWKERLFSRPWQPLRRTRTITPQVPMKGGYRIGTGSILMHPETVRQLRSQLASSEKGKGGEVSDRKCYNCGPGAPTPLDEKWLCAGDQSGLWP